MSDLPISPMAGTAETQCRRHPDRMATLVCSRCGDYICSACRRPGVAAILCDTCAERTGEAAEFPPGLSWGIGAVVGTSLSVFKQTLGTGLGLGLIALFLAQLPMGVGMAYIQSHPEFSAEIASFAGSSPGIILAAVLAYILVIWISMRVMAAQVFAAHAGFFRQRSGIGACWDRSGGCVWPMFVNLALLPGAFGATCFLALALMMSALGVVGIALGIIGFLALTVILAIWLLRVAIVATPIIAFERPAASLDASRRAWALTRGKALDIFVIGLIVLAMAMGIGMISVGVTMVSIFTISPPTPGSPTLAFAPLLISQVANAFLQLFFSYATTCIAVGIYHGLRTLKAPAPARPVLQALPV